MSPTWTYAKHDTCSALYLLNQKDMDLMDGTLSG